MSNFKSVQGVWFPADDVTKQELGAVGLDHLGIHTSEDPYLKNLEYVTGVPRHELQQAQNKASMDRMMEMMQMNMQIMMMMQAGDKDGALEMMKEIREKQAKEKERSAEFSSKDPIALAREEFEASMRTDQSKYKTVPDKPEDLKNIPKVKEEQRTEHEPVKNILAEHQGVKASLAPKGTIKKDSAVPS